jgi:hypothetical protein
MDAGLHLIDVDTAAVGDALHAVGGLVNASESDDPVLVGMGHYGKWRVSSV